MPAPKLLLAIPFLVIGAIAPAVTRPQPAPAGTDVVGMEQVDFDRETVVVHQGQRIEFVNNSNFLHVIAPGHRARVTPTTGVPSFGSDDVRSMPRGRPFITEPWDTPGSYQLTCTLHPEMNLTVVVVSNT